MQPLRSIAALVAGFGFMASTVMVGTMLATALFVPEGLTPSPEGLTPSPEGLTPAPGGLTSADGTAGPGGMPAGPLPIPYLVATLATNLLGAVFGGWLAARIGASAPFGHAVALAALTAVLSIAAVVQRPAGAQPAWYPIVVGIIGVAGVLAGGKLRAAAASAGAVVA